MPISRGTVLAVLSAMLLMLAGSPVGWAVPLTGEPAEMPVAMLAPQGSTTLLPTDDATIKSWQPDSNFGDATVLEVSNSQIDTAKRAASLLTFFIPRLPSGAVIDSAVMRLYLYGSWGTDPVDITAWLIMGIWYESSVTWNTVPAPQFPFGSVNAAVDSTAGYKSWDMTFWLKDWLQSSNFSVILYGPNGSSYYGRTFISKEGGIHPPQLVITYHIECPADSYEPNDSFVAAAGVTPDSPRLAYICPSGDDDYYRFTVSSGQQMQIDLDGAGGGDLPADYDIELYDPGQSYVTQSNAGGTLPEQIIYTADRSGTWYVRLLGYNGAYSADDPYRLRLSFIATPTSTSTSTPTSVPSPTSTPTRTSTPTPTTTPTATPASSLQMYMPLLLNG